MTRRTSLKKRLIVFLAAQIVTTGCVFVPRTVQHRELVRSETHAPEPASAAQILLEGKAEQRRLIVRAWARQTCRQKIVDVYQRTESTKLGFESNQDPRLRELWFFGSCITGPLSFLINAPIVAFTPDKATVERDPYTRTSDCSHPLASERVLVQLPSGRIFDLVTNAEGIATLELPGDEPESGELALSYAYRDIAPVKVTFGAVSR